MSFESLLTKDITVILATSIFFIPSTVRVDMLAEESVIISRLSIRSFIAKQGSDINSTAPKINVKAKIFLFNFYSSHTETPYLI